MKKPIMTHLAATAILALAEIKSAAEAFDQGDSSAFDTLDVIMDIVDAYRRSPIRNPRQDSERREAA